MPKWVGKEKVERTMKKIRRLTELQMPCANGPCESPAIHVVSGHFDYPEKVESKIPGKGSRWESRRESFLLYMCRDHRDKWLRKNTEVHVGGGLI